MRAEVSKKNKHWIERERYHELRHFCLQYPIWKHLCESLESYGSSAPDLLYFQKSEKADPTEKCAEAREKYQLKIDMIELSAQETDPSLATYILDAVTENYSYTYMKAYRNVPCSRDVWYDTIRKFFWILNKYRD